MGGVPLRIFYAKYLSMVYNRSAILGYLVGLVFWCSPGSSQERFISYDRHSGLDADHITCIAEDSLGYMWFGSNNGLIRYDGYQFEYFYTRQGDSASLSGNYIIDIQTGPKGRLWIATHDRGICVYDYSTEKFTRIPFLDVYGTPIDPTPIWKVWIDKTGQVWLATSKYGIVRLDKKNYHWVLPADSRRYLHARDIYPDPNDDKHFYSASSTELRYYSIETGDYRVVKKKEDWDWNHLLVDTSGDIWNTLYLDGLTHLSTKNKRTWKKNWTGAVTLDLIRKDEETLWMATEGQGIRVYHTRTHTSERILPKPFDRSSLPCKFILSLHKDKSGKIWIGTAIGISLWDPKQQQIKAHLVNYPASANPLMVSDYWEVPGRKTLVAGYYYDRLLHLNSIGPVTSDVEVSPSARHLIKPYNIYPAAGKIFVFYSNGIGLYDPSKDLIRPYRVSHFQEVLSRRGAGDVLQDPHQHFWLTRPPNILIHLNPYSGDIDTFHIGYPSNIYFSRSLYYQNDSIIWLEHNGELFRLNTLSRRRHKFFPSANDKIDRLGINDIRVTPDNTVWLTTDTRALLKLGYTHDTLKELDQFEHINGLPSDVLGDIIQSKDGRLMVGTNQGIGVYLPKFNGFYTVDKSYGLLDNEVLSLRDKGKVLLATHKMGFSIIRPEHLIQEHTPPQIHIQYINFSNEHAQVYSTSFHIKTPVPYTHNDVSIGYLAFHYNALSTISYRYKLSGVHDWIVGSQLERVARYNNLQPGKYRFEVEAKRKDGIWSSPARIDFEIKAPFWRTTWFIIGSTLFIATIIYALLMWRWRQVKEREKLKNKYELQISQIQLQALRAQMNPHFMFNSLNSIKNYILKNETTLAAEYLSSFSHLIRMILQFSKSTTISMKEEIEVLLLYIDLEKLRFRDTFSFQCQIDKEIDMTRLQIPPMLLQPYVENAIWHGLLHKKEDRILNIKLYRSDANIICEIEDNGIGRDAAKLLKSKSASRYKSMGMSIVNDRIQLLNSSNSININIEVTDKVYPDGSAAGTLIKLIIPYAYYNH